jgi:hypothetical protein
VVVGIVCQTTPYYVGVTFEPVPQFYSACTTMMITDGTNTWNLSGSQLPPYGQPSQTFWFATQYPSNGSYTVTFQGDTSSLVNCACYAGNNGTNGTYLGSSGTLGSGSMSSANQDVTVTCIDFNVIQ